jgi:hypothetical protein
MVVLAVLTVVAAMMLPTGQTKEQGNESHRIGRGCKSVKPYLVKKRRSTWKWQDTIYVPRTRTSHAERRTHGCAYLRWIARLWAGRADETFERYVELQEPREAICHVFGVYCDEALDVAWCESKLHITAENGQYKGLFQMGSSERDTFGHGDTALEQSVAAERYFISSGRDWSPWSCKPH